ncbi:MAG TPA: HD domain-containing protein, partial [Acidobacteriaceae bacterium]
MATVQPQRPGPARAGKAGGQVGVPEPAAETSESGMGLEATLPAVPAEPIADKPVASLDEPSGVFAAPTAMVAGDAAEPSLLSAGLDVGATGAPVGEEELSAKFEHMLATLQANRPADDVALIRAAWAFCQEQHEGQQRASGEAYVTHPLEVAQVLADLKMDATAIAAGLLHDAVEDTDVSTQEIERRFGE